MLRDRCWWPLWLALIVIVPNFGLAESASTDDWALQREQYQQAMTALRHGKSSLFNQLKAELRDYPLLPYLEYAALQSLIKRRTPKKAVHSFLSTHADSPLAARLKHQWLRRLATRGQWQNFLEFYSDDVESVELKCYALWAKHKLGATDEALAKVEQFWLVNHSQPRSCDPIFKLWQDSGALNDDLLWRRFSMAMAAGNTQLARYLIRSMSGALQPIAQRYRELHFYPQRLDKKSFARIDAKNEEILLHTLQRLARRDAPQADALWRHYFEKVDINPYLRQHLNRQITLHLARQNQTQPFRNALAAYGFTSDPQLLESGIEMFLRQGQWDSIHSFTALLPETSKHQPQWRYWLARSAQHLPPNFAQTDGQALYAELASTRDYYGFLAADRIDTQYRLNAQSYPLDEQIYQQTTALPGMQRARELYLLGELTDARREWFWTSKNFSSEQQYAAAHMAHQIGWESQAIRGAIDAEKWDDLLLRFPLAYRSSVEKTANKRQLDPNWMFAIARQESAMTFDARSPKGASGLMQFMPATAKIVSKKHGIAYSSPQDLLNPEKSIELAGAYLQDLLQLFDGNSIYATAAYNAGPHRVNRWIKENGHLPLDIWIEAIPFSETRQYVKNVLAYSVIFANLRQDKGFRMATHAYLNSAPQIAERPSGAPQMVLN